jgi:predicted NBD/HSP70 family sugar kinase
LTAYGKLHYTLYVDTTIYFSVVAVVKFKSDNVFQKLFMFNGPKSANKHLVRQLNIAAILHSLRISPTRTRALLSASTGLTRATVSSLIDELMTLNLVRETGLQPSRGGRPGTSIELNPDGGSAIGVEIGVDFASVVLTDFVANVLWRDRVTLDIRNWDRVMAIVEGLIDEASRRSIALGLKLFGIGVGLPGLVNVEEGTLKIAPNLDWRDISVKARWEKHYGVPIYVANEGSAAALGEHYFGVAAPYHDFVYLSVSTVGIGAGIIIGGNLFQGVDGYAGEFGHIVLDPAGPPCSCGRRGCWEKVAGAASLITYVTDQVAAGKPSLAVELAEGNIHRLTTDIVAQAALAGDPVALGAMQSFSRMFGIGVLNLINVFNPQAVVIGGALVPTIAPFLPLIQGVVDEQAFRPMTGKVAIMLSQLGDDACLMGAVAAVLDVILADPSKIVERV